MLDEKKSIAERVKNILNELESDWAPPEAGPELTAWFHKNRRDRRAKIRLAVRKGFTARQWVLEYAKQLREFMSANDLPDADFDRLWDIVNEAENGDLEKVYAEVFKAIRRQMQGEKPARKVARKRIKR